jgi:preprotein translocase subunit SecG
VVQALVTILLVVVILIQKSEGGGLGVGGSLGLHVGARCGRFHDRMTQVLGGLFVALSIILAALAVKSSSAQTFDDSLNRAVPTAPPRPRRSAGKTAPAATNSPAPAAPLDPLAGSAKSKHSSMMPARPAVVSVGRAALVRDTPSTQLWIDFRIGILVLVFPHLTIKARFP